MKKRHSSEQELFEAIALIQSADEAKQFLHDLCTPMERQSMADRWRVLELLKQGKPYRKIYEETGVSVTTVGRVARTV
ncbi:MAG: YerC/YecD family TrpR-related protein, partial [Gammaproteobacteria bacterium]